MDADENEMEEKSSLVPTVLRGNAVWDALRPHFLRTNDAGVAMNHQAS